MGAGQRVSGRRAPGVRLAEIDAVTIDSFGTLLRLRDPVPRLAALLPGHDERAVAAAFRAEVAYYEAHTGDARDAAGLAALHADCTAVFNQALGSGAALTPQEYLGAFVFEVVPGVRDALARLRALGLSLAVVANWDLGLHEHLRGHGLRFDAVVTAGDAPARKPDPAPFLAALERLAVEPKRAVHVGDHRPHDEAGALAAGLRFAPAPLAEAVATWR